MENILTTIATFILGYVAGIYLPKKFRKDDKMPNISISPFQERQNYFDVTNHGGDILNLQIKINFKLDGANHMREMVNFFNSTEDPAFGRPHRCNSIKRGETKKVVDCSSYSDDGRVEVQIEGTDVDGRKFNKSLILKNNIKNR